jgi:senataxin
MCRPKGFTLLQGPPGTGKTKTIVAILNCFHLVQYQFYYDSLVHFFLDLLFVNQALESSTPAKVIVHSEVRKLIRKKPRILVCAPSNAGVDEILDRLFVDGLLDGDLKKYTPGKLVSLFSS